MSIEINIWIYWLFCAIATVAISANWNFIDRLFSYNANSFRRRKGYRFSLVLGWLATILAATAYVAFTYKLTDGFYKVLDLIVFALLNGILEQFMFVFWFVFGCYLGRLYFSKNLKIIFITGYISNFIFSGLIHGLFWIKVLPAHEITTSIIIPLLATASLMWMWLLWRYRAIVAIVAMHVMMDFVAIGHLHFNWFEVF